MPVDDQQTRVIRFASFRATDQVDRDRLDRFFHEVVQPRAKQVSAEDAIIAAAQGSLHDARSNEFLFNHDQETVKLRRQLKSAYLAQRDGTRTGIAKEALAFPV